jgi:hypothetical protein
MREASATPFGRFVNRSRRDGATRHRWFGSGFVHNSTLGEGPLRRAFYERRVLLGLALRTHEKRRTSALTGARGRPAFMHPLGPARARR